MEAASKGEGGGRGKGHGPRKCTYCHDENYTPELCLDLLGNPQLIRFIRLVFRKRKILRSYLHQLPQS